jgi:hypothetical protein
VHPERDVGTPRQVLLDLGQREADPADVFEGRHWVQYRGSFGRWGAGADATAPAAGVAPAPG